MLSADISPPSSPHPSISPHQTLHSRPQPCSILYNKVRLEPEHKLQSDDSRVPFNFLLLLVNCWELCCCSGLVPQGLYSMTFLLPLSCVRHLFQMVSGVAILSHSLRKSPFYLIHWNGNCYSPPLLPCHLLVTALYNHLNIIKSGHHII